MKNLVALFVVFFVALFSCWNAKSALAQYVAETAECFQEWEGENLHEQWMKAKMQGRLDIVEQIGEDGADRVCRE